MAQQEIYFSKNKNTLVPFSPWDLIALVLILGIIFLVALGLHQMSVPYHVGEALPISLEISNLPEYAFRTVLRMFFALGLSLLFTFTVGTLAAKSKEAERLIIPMIDILQSVPVLGFLSITVVGFINLFPGSLLGPECAAIFAIFTAQVWNMTLSFYQSLRTVPSDLVEATKMFHLSAWQRFWRVDVPFAVPGLLWNTMMSMSGSWFFVVASEAISVANQNITLPGIGSYIALAIAQADGYAVLAAIVAMFIVILLYDQILFRPLVVWAEKFKAETTASEFMAQAWLTKLLQRSYILHYLGDIFVLISDRLINFPLLREHKKKIHWQVGIRTWINVFWYSVLAIFLIASMVTIISYITHQTSLNSILQVFFLGLVTGLRVLAVVALCTLIWIPLGVWIGMKPKFATKVQPILQFMAAFPAYLLFPLVVFFIVRYHLNVEIWVTPLMFIGAQWYIAFNVIAGAMAIPEDLQQVASNFNLKGWLYWRRLILPAIFPYYITGAITAAGGAWNVSIVAEVVQWGQTRLNATGLGAFITEATKIGDFPQVALGIMVMSLYVTIINRVLWRPLYVIAQSRYTLE